MRENIASLNNIEDKVEIKSSFANYLFYYCFLFLGSRVQTETRVF